MRAGVQRRAGRASYPDGVDSGPDPVSPFDREAPVQEPEPEPEPVEEPEYPQDPGPAEDPEKQPVRE